MLENPYRGINAHLHSIAQNPQNSPTIWTSIHASHIGDIINRLNGVLASNYIARAEQSLQIWTREQDGERIERRSPRPDVSIYRTGASTQNAETAVVDQSPVRVISLDPYMEHEITIPAAVIYEVVEHEVIGKAVTRIELLSASNKRDGAGHRGYMSNRLMALESGTSLIELDYLHQSESPLPGVPPYPYAPDSHAYGIAVTDRRDGYREDNVMLLYIVDVDMPLPGALTIPLAGDDTLKFDFDAVYQYTFRTGRWGIHVDYASLPRNFETYSETDQRRIKSVIERIPRDPT